MNNNDKNILIVNLGSPNSLSLDDIKKYLNQFLSDDMVIDLPKIIQQILIKLIILPFRSPKTLKAYEKIWTKNGSPLIYNTKSIAQKLSKKNNWNIEIAMRYQNPSIDLAIKKFKKYNVKEIIILPLYPHHAMSTTETTKKYILERIDKIYPTLKIKYVEPFYNHPKYIESLKKSIKPYLKEKFDKLIFSYHGIPERHIKKSDNSKKHCLKNDNCCEIVCKSSEECYRANVYTTSNLVAKELKLEKNQWMISFQSRVTYIDPYWLKPYTDIELNELPDSGVKKLP